MCVVYIKRTVHVVRKILRKHSLHGKIAAPGLLKLFINGSKICTTTEAP